MEQLGWNQSSLPDDLALQIVSLLEAKDVCALGSCSRFWRELCFSDCLWAALCRERWPSLDFSEQFPVSKRAKGKDSSNDDDINRRFSPVEGWRSFYIKRHEEMASRARFVAKFVKHHSQSESLEVGNHLRSIEQLYTMELGFKDVEMFLFASKQNALLNLVGIHYSIYWLEVPANLVLEALWSRHISQRQVCVRWWKLGRWFYGFRLRDESHSRRVSLADLVVSKEEEVLGLLQRGAVHEVLRIQISVAGDDPCTQCAYENIHSLG